MNTVFADTFAWLALVNRKDAWHQRVRDFLDAYSGRIVTSTWVLVELADALAATPEGRAEFISLCGDLQTDPDVIVVNSDRNLLDEAVKLYRDRPDKKWSLTDCTSFVIMQRHGIFEALSGDHHFEQAGLVVLFK